MTTVSDRPPRGPLVALGVLSIVAFGSWFYGFGVLLEPIRDDTGWPESILTTTYGASLLVTGVGAAIGGGVIDRRGGRRLFVSAGVAAAVLLTAASYARDPLAFAVTGTLAGGVIGAAGYYHATQAVIGRIAPRARTRGMTALTLWGAFASPVFLPALGPIVLSLGWRPTFRLLAVVVGLAFVAAGMATPGDDAGTTPTSQPSMLGAMRRTGRVRSVRRLYLAGIAMGAGTSVLLLYQVPAMVAAGLPLGVASGLAGARGFVQLGGRIPLPAVVRRWGSFRTLRVSLVLTAVGAVMLPLAGDLPTGVAFVLVAGVAIGAMAALEGIYAADLVAPGVLGTTLGVFSLLRGLGAAVGPIAGGMLVDGLGSRVPTLLLSAAMVLVAAAVLRPPAADVDAQSPKVDAQSPDVDTAEAPGGAAGP